MWDWAAPGSCASSTRDLTNQGPLILLSGFQTPAAIRAVGFDGLLTWLRDRKVRSAVKLASVATEASRAQSVSIGGQATAAILIVRLAATVLKLNDELSELPPYRPATS